MLTLAKSGYITTSADYSAGNLREHVAKLSFVVMTFAREIGVVHRMLASKDGYDSLALCGRMSYLSPLGQNSN